MGFELFNAVSFYEILLSGKIIQVYETFLSVYPGTKRQIGSAIRPKNSRLVVPPSFILRDTADSSGPDQWILHNLSSYESPESPLSLWV